jgi:3-mercaptopyruvate sulfurtransferase SseA
MPIILIAAGVVLALGLLIWQISRQAGSQAGQTLPQAGATLTTSQVKRATLAEAKQAFDQDQAIFLDVRPPVTYEAGHVAGSLNIPLEELETRLGELDPQQWIIPYCT